MRAIWCELLALVVAVGATSTAGAYEPIAVRNGGMIAGVIKFGGTPPAPRTLKITKDQRRCGSALRDESLSVAGDRGIKNVVVRIMNIGKGKAWNATAVIEQRKCQLHPRVAIAQIGAAVEIINYDEIIDDIFYIARANPTIHEGPMLRKRRTWRFGRPEIVQVVSAAHPWALSWLVVSVHPYVAVTDEKGTFRLTDVPPGEYKVELWHETLGNQEKTVKVVPNIDAGLEAEFAKH